MHTHVIATITMISNAPFGIPSWVKLGTVLVTFRKIELTNVVWRGVNPKADIMRLPNYTFQCLAVFGATQRNTCSSNRIRQIPEEGEPEKYIGLRIQERLFHLRWLKCLIVNTGIVVADHLDCGDLLFVCEKLCRCLRGR